LLFSPSRPTSYCILIMDSLLGPVYQFLAQFPPPLGFPFRQFDFFSSPAGMLDHPAFIYSTFHHTRPGYNAQLRFVFFFFLCSSPKISRHSPLPLLLLFFRAGTDPMDSTFLHSWNLVFLSRSAGVPRVDQHSWFPPPAWAFKRANFSLLQPSLAVFVSPLSPKGKVLPPSFDVPGPLRHWRLFSFLTSATPFIFPHGRFMFCKLRLIRRQVKWIRFGPLLFLRTVHPSLPFIPTRYLSPGRGRFAVLRPFRSPSVLTPCDRHFCLCLVTVVFQFPDSFSSIVPCRCMVLPIALKGTKPPALIVLFYFLSPCVSVRQICLRTTSRHCKHILHWHL